MSQRGERFEDMVRVAFAGDIGAHAHMPDIAQIDPACLTQCLSSINEW